MTFLEACIQDSLPIWESCLDTKFLKGIADGTPPEECCKGYIVDDSLYLREYAKVFAWGILHAASMEEIRNYYSLLAFVNEAEDSTRRYYFSGMACGMKRYSVCPCGRKIRPMWTGCCLLQSMDKARQSA